MTYRPPLLTDLELHYPFTPRSRKFFETIPIDETLSSKEVILQAESRLLNAIGKGSYDPHLSELVEFLSFFVAALVASQDNYLANKFARKEAERARVFFISESPKSKVNIMKECFGIYFDEGVLENHIYQVRLEDYLALVSKHDLIKSPKWKLVNQSVNRGKVFFNDNLLNDLFTDCARSSINVGLMNLRKGTFPKQLLELKTRMLQYIPPSRKKAGKTYLYIEELMKYPVSDGRHRLVWLVLAPYLVNIKGLGEDEAIEKIRSYISVTGETREMKKFIEYNVKRARRNKLMPPTLRTLKLEHPDLYSLLPKQVVSLDSY